MEVSISSILDFFFFGNFSSIIVVVYLLHLKLGLNSSTSDMRFNLNIIFFNIKNTINFLLIFN